MRQTADIQTMEISQCLLPPLQIMVEWSLVVIFVLVKILNTNNSINLIMCKPVWIFYKEKSQTMTLTTSVFLDVNMLLIFADKGGHK